MIAQLGIALIGPLGASGLLLVAFLTLGFLGAPLWAWTAAGAAWLLLAGAPIWLWIVFALVALVFNVPSLRTRLATQPIMSFMNRMKFLPAISETERTAIEAGTVWMDGELFSGKPDFERLLGVEYGTLSADERAFLDGPVETVCAMTDDWEVFQARDLPPAVWDYLKRERFLGMIIPKEYGGLGFSAEAHSAVIAKLSSRSGPLAITVMVPNSLGPAELLMHYGTDEQKAHYLPRLADGRELPCFALTETGAGSDAGAIASRGTVFKADDGALMLRLDWDKRYITLAAISTLLGLAFKLEDPDELLGRGKHLGITCALVPTEAQGVELGKRHDPLGVPFYNCPTRGRGVVVPIDSIIGGRDGAGRGWQMLMETLAAGRGISLPALSTAGAKAGARIAGAYAAVRKQFGLPIGKFEGIEEPLARLGGFAYTLEAARRYTTAAIDGGAKPAVVTAMAKYSFTEIARKCVNDAMDICAGAGISRGPRNLLAHSYMGAPISITVEGANILTRTLMIFGQGAIRCHPYAYAEIQAVAKNDVGAFDRAFWGHVGHVVRNACRAFGLSLSRGRLASVPVDGPSAIYAKQLAWSSASFAFFADVAMASLGGDLKRKETITGRFSDIFSWMYLANATMKRFEFEGRREADLPFYRWSMEYALARIQEAFDGLFANFDVPVLGAVLAGPVALWSRMNRLSAGPDDALGHAVAQALQVPGAQREALCDGLYVPHDPEQALGQLEAAFRSVVEAEHVAAKIKAAIKAGMLPRKPPLLLIDEAVEKGVITSDQAWLVERAEEARSEAVRVDEFTLEEYLETAQPRDDSDAALARTRSA